MKKYTWIVALLLALTMAFIGCPNDGGDDPDKPVEPVEPVEPGGNADPIDVEFTQDMLDVWGGGSIVAEADNSGFTFTYGSGDNNSHGNAVAMFKVDLGETKVSDYEKVTFTFTGISGDLGPNTGQYDVGTAKGVNLLAAANKDNLKDFGGHDEVLVTYIVNAFSGAASGATINAAGAKIGTQPAAIDLELAIAPTRPQASNTGEVWFSIYLHASAVKWENGSATTEKTIFKITNVTFVPFGAVDVTVTEKDILGVTAPARGQTPVTTIADAAQYTGAVAWAPELDADGKFAPSTAYTATITLTAKSGYTFEGVEADFFTVEHATATNPANSGVVTAVFPATVAEDQANPVTILAIEGVTAPVRGANPVTTAPTATTQWNASAITWTPAVSGGVFDYDTQYTATFTLTAADDFTFEDVTGFTVTGATVTFEAGDPPTSGTIRAVFPATAARTMINIAEILGVDEPIRGHDPKMAIEDTAQYIGTVTWAPELDADGKFAAETAYTATITLIAKDGFTFNGVAANFFTVDKATTVTNPANSGVVTAVFSATSAEGVDTPVDDLVIVGVIAPVGGETPVTTAPTATDQWTASAVTWKDENGNAVGATFDYETVYTATFTLTAEVSLTFDGIDGDFTVDGATVTYVAGEPPNTVTITAVFPATLADVPRFTIKVNSIDQNAAFSGSSNATVTKIDDPVKGINIANTAGYGGAYAYFEVDFGTGKTLADYPKLTFKWKGISGDTGNKDLSVWVSGTTFSGSVVQTDRAGFQNFGGANSNTGEQTGEIYLYAPAVTGQKAFIALNIWADSTAKYEVYDIAFAGYTATMVTLAAIPGVAAPMTGQAPATTITTNAQYAGTIVWSPAVAAGGTFAANTAYTATITLSAKPPYTFTGVTAFTVAGATVTYTAGTNIVTAEFPATVAPLLSFPITYTGGTPTGATTEVLYSAVKTVNATVSPEQNGYAAITTQGNRYTLPGVFVINLGDKTLADFASVTYTFQGVDGDFGYKRFGLLAAAAATGLPTTGGYTIADFLVSAASTGGSGNPVTNQTGGSTNLNTQTLTAVIVTTQLSGNAVWTSHEIEICIWEIEGNASPGVNFKITNITFNP
jgi:hypothetical protein